MANDAGCCWSRRSFLAAGLAGLASSCATMRQDARRLQQRPNIVFILADDMGVGDVQALWPGKVPTPHLDRLVAQGMHFTDAHSGSAVCTPTRYGLLTGRYAWRTRLQEWVIDAHEPPLIAEDRLTLPAMLQDRGYHTACIGKWHLGWDWTGEGEGREMRIDVNAPIRSGPTTRGFDYYFGTDVPNFPPFTFIENETFVTPPTDSYKVIPNIRVGFEGAPMAPGWKFEEILPTITQRAVDYIHDRSHAAQQEAQPFFLYFPMTSPHEPLSPSPAFQGKSGIAPIADFLMETDWSVGQIIQAIEDAGIAEDTLLIFATDNGHAHYTGWDELVAAGHHPSGPFRGHKGTIYEGGHRVPMIVRWPGVVAPGSQSDELLCLNDVMATCVELVGETLPEHAAEDSVSFLHLLQGRGMQSPRGHLVHHDVDGNFALRQGPWKLIIFGATDEAPTRYELYNLQEDPAETTDLSNTHPERVDQMVADLQALVAAGRSTPGAPQRNDTPDVDILNAPKERWGRPW